MLEYSIVVQWISKSREDSFPYPYKLSSTLQTGFVLIQGVSEF